MIWRLLALSSSAATAGSRSNVANPLMLLAFRRTLPHMGRLTNGNRSRIHEVHIYIDRTVRSIVTSTPLPLIDDRTVRSLVPKPAGLSEECGACIATRTGTVAPAFRPL